MQQRISANDTLSTDPYSSVHQALARIPTCKCLRETKAEQMALCVKLACTGTRPPAEPQAWAPCSPSGTAHSGGGWQGLHAPSVLTRTALAARIAPLGSGYGTPLLRPSAEGSSGNARGSEHQRHILTRQSSLAPMRSRGHGHATGRCRVQHDITALPTQSMFDIHVMSNSAALTPHLTWVLRSVGCASQCPASGPGTQKARLVDWQV